MKRFAVRGLVTLAIVVACSMFFAQTIVTITTPKVKLEQARQGRFEDEMRLTGELYFDSVQGVTPEGMQAGASVTVQEVFVRAGDYVQSGDLIATTEESAAYEDSLEEARKALSAAHDAYRDNELANIRLVPNTDSDKNSAYQAAADAERALQDAQIELLTQAAQAGLVLPADTSQWAALVQAQGDAALIEGMERVIDAKLALDEANAAFIEVNSQSRTKEALYTFLQKRRELQAAIDEAQAKLIELVAQTEALRSIRAPHAGYVTELNLEAGKAYDGSQAAFSLSEEGGEPVLRVNVSGTDRTFAEGMSAKIAAEYGDIEAQVTGVSREGAAEKYAYIALDEDAITRLGGLRSLMRQGTVDVRVTYRAKENTTLVPASAVRNEGEGKDFVYTVETTYTFWGTQMKAVKRTVTVLERSDTTVSVREELRWEQLCDKEDRALTDGAAVMEYVN